MLTALKIGLLALMPLMANGVNNSVEINHQQLSNKYVEAYSYLDISGYEVDVNIQLVYSGLDGEEFPYIPYNQSYSFQYEGYENGVTQSNSASWIYDNSSWIYLTDLGDLIFLEDGGEPMAIADYKDVDYGDIAYIYYQLRSGASMDSEAFEEFNEAIEQDIANANMPSISDIFAEVTSAITSFVGSLGQAFNSVTALFYANGSWTFLGVLILIGVGVGLVYGAYRLIKGLLHRV